MEKRKAHHALSRVKALIRENAYRITSAARRTADEDFGLHTEVEIAACIEAITTQEFYKSMTTYHDHRIWQDVYVHPIGGVDAYVKIQIQSDETVVISFKRRD